jgi:hypothetical protein
MVDNSNHASCWILNSMAIQLLATEKIRNFVSLSLDFKKIKHKVSYPVIGTFNEPRLERGAKEQ